MAFFAARQPILDIDKKVFGYELLFRTSTDNVFPDIDEEKATSKMIEGLQFDLGLDKISSGKFAFINFTEQSILQLYPKLLPKQKVVIEILETVRPTPEVYEQIKVLFDNGYTIALDDFIHSEAWEPFYELCKIIKIDCLDISSEQLNEIANLKTRYPHIVLLAEKVETYEQFKEYKKLGFTLFQGYFFSKPEVMKSVSMSSTQSLLASLLNEVTQDEPNIGQITKLMEIDVALSFKVLRYTQSPLFQRRKKIDSIRHAIVMLGKKELESFTMLLFAASFGENKPSELIKLSIHRAKFCEQLALLSDKKDQVSSAFLVGMLSLIDAMLDANIEDLIGEMSLADKIKQALLVNKGWLANAVSLCKLMEKGDWQQLDKACALMNVDCDEVAKVYAESGEWAEQRLTFII